MNDVFMYRPYKLKSLAFFIPFSILGVIISFVGVGACLAFSGTIGLCLTLTATGMLGIWVTITLYVDSKKIVCIDKNGVTIIGDSRIFCSHISWAKIPCACYIRNFRGHLVLILSADKLEYEEARRFANWWTSRICFDNVVVIHLKEILAIHLQETSQLKELIESYVMHIDTW